MKGLSGGFPKAIQVQFGNCSRSNEPHVNGEEKPRVSEGLCAEMEGRGHACVTPFDRNIDGDFVRQYIQGTLL